MTATVDRRRRAAHPAPLAIALALACAASAEAASLTLLSVPDDPLLLGTQADRYALVSCELSSTGRYAVFVTAATQLVADDDNGVSDVFVRDRLGGTVERLSRRADGSETREPTTAVSASDDARFVAMVSTEDLIGNAAPGPQQVYLLDRQLDTLVLVSKSAAGFPGNETSNQPRVDSSGAFVVFSSSASNLISGDGNGFTDVFRYDIAADTLLRVSTDSLGNEADGHSSTALLAAGGNIVAFSSLASNLVAGDTNGLRDVFVKDLSSGATELITVGLAGASADASIGGPSSISANGDVVAFSSVATNLVPGDTNGSSDVFVRRRSTASTLRASVDAAGGETSGSSRGGSLGDNGRLVAFISDADNLAGANPGGFDQIFLKDLQTGSIDKLTSADSDIRNVFEFSGNDARLCFNGGGEALVGGDSNRVGDLYTLTLATQMIERVNLAQQAHPVRVGNGSSRTPDISADGLKTVFASSAALLDAEGFADAVAVSVSFVEDIYLRDAVSGDIARLSNAAFGGGGGDNPSGFPAISADGRFAVFESYASNLVVSDGNDDSDVFRVDTASGALLRISESLFGEAGRGRDASISDSGTRIAFVSTGADLVADDVNNEQDVFVWDVVDGIRRVSVAGDGTEAEDGSFSPELSGDGSVVVFASDADNLVAGDGNGRDDIFVHTLASGEIERLSVATNGDEANGDSFAPSISRDGRRVAFMTDATNLAPGDVDPGLEVILADRTDGSLRSASAGLALLGLRDPAQPYLSANGRQVLFYAFDNDGFTQLLRYDDDTGHLLLLVPGGPDGATDSSIPGGYAVSDEGTIVFDWIDPLLPADNNDPRSESDIYALRLEPGALALAGSQAQVGEGAGVATLSVRRLGGTDGRISVDYATEDGSAIAGPDYAAASGTLTWEHADDTTRFIQIALADDTTEEDDETLIVRLRDTRGGAELGTAELNLTIVDDDAFVPQVFEDGFED